MRLALAILLSALAGFVALSYEIVWFRVFAYASTDRPTSFGFMLGCYLAGIAFGSLGSRRFCRDPAAAGDPRTLRALGGFVAAANVFGFVVTPLVAWLVTKMTWEWTLPLVGVAAALLGAILPLVAHFAIEPDRKAGARLSYLYVANIVGSSAGSLLTGFVAMDHLSLPQIHVVLLGFGMLMAVPLLAAGTGRRGRRVAVSALIALLAWGAGALVEPAAFDRLYERLQWGQGDDGTSRFQWMLENRHGVIAVDPEGKVYGGGAYDGATNVSLVDDKNWVFRAYATGAIHPHPRRVLMIGLASGSWAQAVAHLDSVEELTVIEINPGYLPLIESEPQVRSVLDNPKVRIVIDDGRRWMRRHPDEKFDVIVQNTTWHWRAHATNLLSVEYMRLTQKHLRPGGVLIYNTTSSADAMRTSMDVFPYGIRMFNCMVVSDSPVVFDKERWRRVLEDTRVDGAPLFDRSIPAHRQRFNQLMALPDSIHGDPIYESLETAEQLFERVPGTRVITDDNMLTEFLWLHE